jgi:hypothetical protein
LKKITILALAAAVFTLSNLSPVFAASMEIYGETKMNLWDLYLTENNAEWPDAISTATVDAVSQATYNPYDNKPVSIETGVTSGLIADSMILEKYGIKNEMVDRILKIWREGYTIRLLGTSDSQTNPLTKKVVSYTADSGTRYYLPYEAVIAAQAASKDKNFNWEAFAKQTALASETAPPYQVKFLLNSGAFGRRTIVGAETVLTPPVLTLDEEFGSKAENLGKLIKFNFENNTPWANAVYAVKVNESGLLQGNMSLGSYSDHNGDTSFIKGQDAADKSRIIIRLSQKFRLGENKLTFMAYGYQDAVYTLNLDQDKSTYPWIVNFRGVNKDNGDEALTAASIVRQGDVLRVEATGSYFSGRYDGLYIDGKPLPKEDTSQGSHTSYYEYSDGGKILSVYTDNLTAGLHELHLIKHGYNDLTYFFTVTTDGLLAPPDLTVQGEEVKVGDITVTGGSVKGTPVILKSSDANLKKWHDSIRKILYINDSTGKINEIATAASSTSYDDTSKTVSISAGSMSYWNSSGNYTLIIRSSGFQQVKVPVKRVNSMPEGSKVSYREADGAVVVTSNYSFMGSDNLQTVVINGKSYPAGTFETVLSYSGSSTLTIPSEYFEPSTVAQITLNTKNYSDLPGKISIPDHHVKRLAAPSVKAEQIKITKNSSLSLSFTDDPSWRAAIQKIVFRSTSNSDNDYKSKSNTAEAGKLAVGPISLSKGSYTLIVTATGYQELKFPVEIVDPVQGAVSYELQPDNSVIVTVAGGSSYVSGLTASLDGKALSGTSLVKNGAAFTVSKEFFTEQKKYQLTLLSSGYADYTLEIDNNAAVPPGLILNGQLDPSSKSASVSFEDNALWRAAITGAELVSSSGNVNAVTVTDKDTPGTLSLSLSGYLYNGDYTLKVSANGFRKAIIPVKLLKSVPDGITCELMSVDGAPQTYISLKNYSYAEALTKIKMGDTLITKGDGFTINTSDYLAIVPGELSGGEESVTLYADNYSDKTLTVRSSGQPPAVSLPGEIAKGAALTLSSGDGAWASAVTGITIGTKSFPSSKLVKDGGKISISADDMKSAPSGKGQAVKISADGYRAVILANVTVYDKPSSAFPQTTEWPDSSLSIDLKDSTTSYSSYSVDKVYLDDSAVSFTKPSYPNYKLIIPASNFSTLSGKTVQIKITGPSYSNLPELTISVIVP